MFAAVLFLLLACLCGIGWIGWQMMPLCPSEDGFAGHDLRENSHRPAGRYEGETQGAGEPALCVGSVNE
jgi:hypothetical protein